MIKNTIELTLIKDIVFVATRYANKNWRVCVKDKETNEEEMVDRSVTRNELQYLIDKALDFIGKDFSLKTLKVKFKFIIKNYSNICTQ